jgi:hypothetical protein
MSDPVSETKEARAQEAAAIRRRWITLGEVLAVLAVLISGLTLYLNWAQQSDERADKVAENRRASTKAAILVLNAEAVNDDRLVLKPAADGQIVQSQNFRFPAAVGVAPVDTTGDPRIEAGWFESGLKNAREKARLPDDSVGDERLPVAITTQFMVDGEPHEDVAVYDIGYGVAGRLLSGHRVMLRGLSRVASVKGANAQAMVDGRWAKVAKR